MSIDYERLLIEQESARRAHEDAEQAAWLRDHRDEKHPVELVFMLMAGAGFAVILCVAAYYVAWWLS